MGTPHPDHGNHTTDLEGPQIRQWGRLRAVLLRGSGVVGSSYVLHEGAGNTALNQFGHCLQVQAVKLLTLKADYVGVLLYSLFRMRQTAEGTSISAADVSKLQVTFRIPRPEYLPSRAQLYTH